MGKDVFDYFGGMANLPDDSGDDELDLSDLDSLKNDSSSTADEASPEPSASEPVAADTPRASAQKPEPKSPAAESREDESHWLDLAGTLGVAISSTQFEPTAHSPPKTTARPSPPPKKKPQPAPKKPTAVDDDFGFARGLLDEPETSAEELRQKELLSQMFVPTNEPLEEPTSEIRIVDDVEIDDIDEIEDIDEAEVLDDDMVEFEVEELTGEHEQGRREFGRRPSEISRPSESARPARARSQEDTVEPIEGESPQPAGDRQRDRPERGRRRGRRGSGRGESRGEPRGDQRGEGRGEGRPDTRGDRPPRHRPEKKVRSEVLPADEDFIIDPIDDELDDQATDQPETGDTRTIKFPTWNETVAPIIEANIARRSKTKGRPPRRPNRDRGSRD